MKKLSRQSKVKIGIIGCGAIGFQLACAVETRLKEKAVVFAVCDIDQIRLDDFLSKIKSKPFIYPLKEVIKKCDFIIESASKDISGRIVKEAVRANKSVLAMSIGGLLDIDIFRLAKKYKSAIYLPSGALAGLDALKAAALADISSVTLTTRKSPKALEGAPFLGANNIDVFSIKQERLIFEGGVSDAVKGFPKNINVAAVLSLVCRGVHSDSIKIRIIAVPGLDVNMHEVQAEGRFGRLVTRTENLPSPDNPKTSYLAALSAVAVLENALSNLKIGT